MNTLKITTVALLLTAQMASSAVQKLILEDATGAWCQYCPRGPIEMEKFRVANPEKVIGITQHELSGPSSPNSDKMKNEFSSELCKRANGYPTMFTNRTVDDDLVKVDSVLKAAGSVAVALAYTWDNATRTITGTVKVTFEKAPKAGDLRPGLMIVENNVVGTGTGYDQANYYNTTNDYPELKGKGNPIKGYKHYYVQRDCPLGGVYGKTGVIPNPPVVGTVYSTPFTYTVPAQYNGLNVVLSNLYLVAFAGYNNGAILNADFVKLNTTTAVKEGAAAAGFIGNGVSVKTLGADLVLTVPKSGTYTITQYALSGRKIATLSQSYLGAGDHSFRIMNSGTSLITVQGNGRTVVQKISVSK